MLLWNMRVMAKIYVLPTIAALIRSKANLCRRCSARPSFPWVVVCQPADTEDFLWAATTKVFLWCWLCYFQQKDGVRHNVYVLTWQWFIPFIPAAIKGELFGWQTVKQVWEANCLWSQWLLKKLDVAPLLQVDLSISAAETAPAPLCFETMLNHFVISELLIFPFFISFPLSLYEIQIPLLGCSAHHKVCCLSHLYRSGYLSVSCVCECVCVCVHVLRVFLSHLPQISALVCRALVCQSCACAYVCLCSSAVLFHSHLQKVTPTR